MQGGDLMVHDLRHPAGPRRWDPLNLTDTYIGQVVDDPQGFSRWSNTCQSLNNCGLKRKHL
jgi:hypothetical protein